ncbi:hypothetical protein VTK73DRAFT_3417 [Phialemonium thermophilum]|uniref:Uncharacterized protein n=1 Tax=Phialemonium thermophilum TaxID=223376 RepID=A0ABR3VIT3_9PEZI
MAVPHTSPSPQLNRAPDTWTGRQDCPVSAPHHRLSRGRVLIDRSVSSIHGTSVHGTGRAAASTLLLAPLPRTLVAPVVCCGLCHPRNRDCTTRCDDWTAMGGGGGRVDRSNGPVRTVSLRSVRALGRHLAASCRSPDTHCTHRMIGVRCTLVLALGRSARCAITLTTPIALIALIASSRVSSRPWTSTVLVLFPCLFFHLK